jgi:hypothetical protein
MVADMRLSRLPSFGFGTTTPILRKGSVQLVEDSENGVEPTSKRR